MPSRQAATIAQSVAATLGVDADPTLWNHDLRRNGALPLTLDAMAGQVADLARRAEIVVLLRDPDALGDLAEAAAFPLVVVAEPAPQRFEAFVLQRREGGELHGVQIAMDGVERPMTVPARGVAGALRRLAREGYGAGSAGTGGAAAGGEVALRVLVPVSVVPTIGVGGASTPESVHEEPAPGGHHGPAGGGAGAHGHGVSPGRRLWELVVREKRDVLLIYGYAALAGLFSLALPLSIQQIVQMISGRMILQPTYILVAFVLLGTIGVGVLQVMQISVVETIQQRVFARIALEFSYRVPRLRYESVLREDMPEAMNRFFETVTIQKSLAKLLIDTSTALLTILFGLILLTLYHPYFTFFSAALVLGLVIIFWVTGPKGLQTSLMESKYKYRAVHWLEEMARAMTAFKFAGRSSLPVERMDEHVSGYLKYRQKHFGVIVNQTISIIGFKTLITGTLLVLGIVLVQNNQITLGQFVASEIVIVTVLAGIEKLIGSLSTVYDILTAVDKLGHVTDMPLEAVGGLALPDSPRGVGITARQVAYHYPGAAQPSLRGIDLTIAPGERIGITGYDGSGQTSLLRALGGLLDSYEGAIAYDGLSLRDLDRTALRDRVGQMLSPTDLFDGTVEENVSVGRAHVSTREVLRALELAGLSEWVQGLPQGLRTEIRMGGRELAQTIVNRLLVAQGIAGNPRLIVFDDFFQNVEPDYREALIHSLTSRDHPWTLLLVSHDPALLAACDRVLVLAEGRIVRQGAFDTLAREDAFLQRLLQRGPVLAR